MSGHINNKYEERPRTGAGRRLSQANMREIRYATAIENSKAQRDGIKPKGSKIIMFSCRCNCFHINVR